MRSNGLTAASYSPVADLEPVTAELLLRELKAHGVAAYAKPVESTAAAGLDGSEVRSGVKDRLYVDAAESARVRELIDRRDPQLVAENDDLRWAQLVAGFDLPHNGAVAPWPVSEDLAPGPAHLDQAEPNAGTASAPPASPLPAARRSFDDDFMASTSAARDSKEDDPERFVPASPPPLPKLSPVKQVAWLGVLGGPLLLLLAALFSLVVPPWLTFLGVAGFVGGFITLVATMGDHSDGDWDSGNGAVV